MAVYYKPHRYMVHDDEVVVGVLRMYKAGMSTKEIVKEMASKDVRRNDIYNWIFAAKRYGFGRNGNGKRRDWKKIVKESMR